MSLPASIGKPGVSAEQLVAESMALEAPLGVHVLSLRPEDYEAVPSTVGTRLDGVIKTFLDSISKGDPARRAELDDAYKNGSSHIPFCLEKAARLPDYTDGHTGWLEGHGGEALGGMIVEPREKNYAYLESAQYLTRVKKEQFLPLNVSDAEGRFMCHWHEVAHCAGAHAEPDADKIAAIVARKAFPDSPVVQVNADLRALDALFTANDKYANDRIRRYGWAMVDAADSVLAMPPEKIRDMSEQDILAFRNEPFDNKAEAVEKIWAALNARDPQTLKDMNLKDTGVALREVLASGALASDPAAQKIAARMGQAIDRLADPAWSPALIDNFNVNAVKAAPAAQSIAPSAPAAKPPVL